MYGLKNLSLSLLFLSSVALAGKTTTIGFETKEESRGETVPLDECTDVFKEDVYTVFTSQFCRVFVGPQCTGKQTRLNPGEHNSKWPIPFINSVYCEPAGLLA
ncbi:hypothetical protein BDV25DRAFT_136604 [Aspergillus avenaceus]|uniref:Uncharacterized protein n=1 Tax=Aspergillus avenaceus TaxID=36643 RepID=A0A5N6U512_ASPAV|nr:hypothetical protein BDV25DRAFT_136604 [Aspergillus avenaceus]